MHYYLPPSEPPGCRAALGQALRRSGTGCSSSAAPPVPLHLAAQVSSRAEKEQEQVLVEDAKLEMLERPVDLESRFS